MSSTVDRANATDPVGGSSPRDLRRVAIATIIGGTVENYDFFLFANAAAIVFGPLFYSPAGPQVAILLSFATVGVSFLFRPLGAFLAGHFGDKYGRKRVLIVTLLLMGISTTLVGVLPTYGQIGLAAPVLLVLLRILMGVSLGGEWGGAVLMSVEHAPVPRRGWFGAFPQMGIPLGLLLSTGMLALMTGVVSPGAQFAEWGWRVPFLLSFVLVVVGILVRRGVEESPVFVDMAKSRGSGADEHLKTSMPVVHVFRKHWLLVILVALTFAGNSAAGYMTTGGFIQSYATTPLSEGGQVGMGATPVLVAVTASALFWLVFTGVGGWLSDRIGRRNTYIVGWVVFLASILFVVFPLVDTGNPWLLFVALSVFSIGNGLTYGPAAANFVELFPASIRYSGVAVTYALGAILGGAFSPLISTALVQATGTSQSVVFYLSGMMAIALAATLLLKDRSRIPLGYKNEREQSVPPIYGITAPTTERTQIV